MLYRYWDMTSNFSGFDSNLWPSEVIWGQQFFILFESPNMTSGSTSMDTISLSCNVLEECLLKCWRPHKMAEYFLKIFDFEPLHVWPWLFTFRGHLRSNLFIPYESPNMTSCLTSIDAFLLYRTFIEIFDFKPFHTFWNFTYDFLFDFYEHHLSILYRSRRIAIQNFEGRTKWRNLTFLEIFDFKRFRFWFLEVIWGLICLYCDSLGLPSAW